MAPEKRNYTVLTHNVTVIANSVNLVHFIYEGMNTAQKLIIRNR